MRPEQVILRVLLAVVVYLAARVSRDQLLEELRRVNDKKVADAIAARDDVLSGRVHADLKDPNRRD